MDERGIGLSETQMRTPDHNFEWVAQGGGAEVLDHFAGEQTLLGKALGERGVSGDGEDDSGEADGKLIKRHRTSRGSGFDGMNVNLSQVIAADAELAARHLQQTRRTWLEHLQTTALAHTEFGQAADPSGIAAHGSHIGPFTSSKNIQRNHRVRPRVAVTETPSHTKIAGRLHSVKDEYRFSSISFPEVRGIPKVPRAMAAG